MSIRKVLRNQAYHRAVAELKSMADTLDDDETEEREKLAEIVEEMQVRLMANGIVEMHD